MKKVIMLSAIILAVSCTNQTNSEESTPEVEKEAVPANASGVTMGSDEYVELHKQMMSHMSNMDFESWGAMLTDDIEYNFPDGDSESRTKLAGKEATVAWWTDWKENSGVSSLTFAEEGNNYVPINVPESDNFSAGVVVLSYVDMAMEFSNGNSVKLRMALNTRWNNDNKISAVYSYYDRMGIIEAMQANILAE